jgi:hypothetical protein
MSVDFILEHCHQVLQQASKLVECCLRIRDRVLDPSRPIIYHSHLHALKLSVDGDAGPLLDRLTSPALRSFQFYEGRRNVATSRICFPSISIIVLSLKVVPFFSVYIPEGRQSNRMPSPHAVSHASRTRPVLWCRNNQQNLGGTHAPSPNVTGRVGQLSYTKTRVHASIYMPRHLWSYFCSHGRVTTTLQQHHAKW